MEAMERWIKALYNGKPVEVRQEKEGGSLFLDRLGQLYDTSVLDFTHVDDNDILQTFTKNIEDSNKRFEEQQEKMDKLLSSMDAKAIADHKAKIDEREYWRKLRGDIAIEFLRRGGRTESPSAISCLTEELIYELYRQDREMFHE